jgi:predicted RNA-binding protein with PUA-like domain
MDISIDSYKALVRTGELVKDAWWYISQNWRKIQIGDEVYVYTGDEDLGIVGFAVVAAIEKRPDAWYIQMDFDLNKCRSLLNHPISAAKVRNWIHHPRKTVVNLEAFESELHSLLPWKC